MSKHLSIVFLAALAVATSTPAPAAPVEARHSLERQVSAQFPSVDLESHATLDQAQELVAGHTVSGFRARSLQSTSSAHRGSRAQAEPLPSDGAALSPDALRVFFPASYNESFAVEFGDQRVVLRAIGAHVAPAANSAGKIFYTSSHDAVDVIEVPSSGRSEELLLLQDARAPRAFEYEIVEMRGVIGVSTYDGAIRFARTDLLREVPPQIGSGRFIAPQPALQIDRPWVIDASGKRSETAAQWSILGENGVPRRIRLTLDVTGLAYPLVVDPSYSTGTWSTNRGDATATLLPNGKLLVAGGVIQGGTRLKSAEIYDPFMGTWSPTGDMAAARSAYTATILPNGKVLIAGGRNLGDDLSTTELYDPATGAFSPGPDMTFPRAGHTATLLPSGKVLIAGGQTGLASGTPTFLTSAQLYDPMANSFSGTGAMTTPRFGHTATLLPNGLVLLTGGNTAELYNPSDGTFAATGSMTVSRGLHTATLLTTGGRMLRP